MSLQTLKAGGRKGNFVPGAESRQACDDTISAVPTSTNVEVGVEFNDKGNKKAR
jgi:hypothetical protein